MSGEAPALVPSTERSALSRLEDLSDYLDHHREVVAVPESTTTGIERSGEGAALLRSNLIVASGTALSRLTGLLRVMVFGYVIGKGALADVYLIGNETPNIVYELLIGGVLSATLVPLFTEFLERDDERATNVVITVSLTAMAVLTAVAVLAAPLIFGLYTVNTQEGVDPELIQRVGTLLTRVFLVQIFFYGAAGLANAALNARRRFLAAAWSPVLANLVVILTLLSLPDRTWQLADVETDERLRWTLAAGTTVGIAVMALVLIPALRSAGLHFRPAFQPRHPAIRRLLTMSLWTFGYVLCNQAVIIVVRNLSEPGSGGSAAYFQAFTFFVLPHGLLAMSIATTFVPEMARAVGRRDRRAFSSTSSLGVRMIAMLTVPAAIVLFVLRRPLIGLLLQHGEYTASDALVTSRALAGFALGLPAFSVYLFALRGFFAHQDTRTPFVINAGQCILNVVFALAAVRPVGRARAGRGVRPVVRPGSPVGAQRAGHQGARLSAARHPRVDRPCAARRGARRRGGVVGGQATRWQLRCRRAPQDRRRQRDHPRRLRRRAVRARCTRARRRCGRLGRRRVGGASPTS